MASFSRAIIHIDGDAFFASCEQSRNPALAGKPVITGKERGIASSMSYEAKAKGVTRAMRLFEIKQLCPDAVILPSDYETYSILSKRFFDIVRRYTADVEEYSIDECFADLTGLDTVRGCSYETIVQDIQRVLFDELGFTFSIGVGPNKLIAKIGSKWKKPFGITVISKDIIDHHLASIPVGKIWGIGPQTTSLLATRGIFTALEFKQKSKDWITYHLSKPFYELWLEMHGLSILPLNIKEKERYDSIQKVKTFTPPSSDKKFIYAQLSKNIESACIKVRKYNLATKEVYFFLRTQEFHDEWQKIVLPRYTSFPHEIIKACEVPFNRIFDCRAQYRSTGITMTKLLQNPYAQRDMFGEYVQQEKLARLYEGVDAMRKKYGKYTILLGSSLMAKKFSRHLGARGDAPARAHTLFKGETQRKRLNIPMFMGKVK
ncbi:MAG: DNA polymerase IV [bacterium]|nr:DNA polymerase IV [bacterium]